MRSGAGRNPGSSIFEGIQFRRVAGDADLIAPIDYIRRVGGRNVVVFNPHPSISGDLKKHATFYKNIPRDLPGRCRLPDEIVYGSHNRVIRCPDAWRVPES